MSINKLLKLLYCITLFHFLRVSSLTNESNLIIPLDNLAASQISIPKLSVTFNEQQTMIIKTETFAKLTDIFATNEIKNGYEKIELNNYYQLESQLKLNQNELSNYRENSTHLYQNEYTGYYLDVHIINSNPIRIRIGIPF